MRAVWNAFFLSFGMSSVHHWVVRDMIKEFPIHRLGRGHFLWSANVCAILWVLWGKRNRRVFRGGWEGEWRRVVTCPSSCLSLGLISKAFCNYPLDFISLLLESLLIVGLLFLWACFFCALVYSFTLNQWKSFVVINKKKKRIIESQIWAMPR